MLLKIRVFVATASVLAAVASTGEAVQAQTHTPSSLEWHAYDGGPDYGVVYAAWSPDCQCHLYMDAWQWNQAANDRAHEAFIDYIWDRDADHSYDDSSSGAYHESYYAPYYPSHEYSYYPVYNPQYDYAMQSWYRAQAANDRAHRAFIEYIRH